VDLLLEFWSHFWVTISLGITAGIVKLFIGFIARILESILNWGVTFIILELFLWNFCCEWESFWIYWNFGVIFIILDFLLESWSECCGIQLEFWSFFLHF
jgi:hypothetical protein